MPGDLGAGSLEALPLDALVDDLGDDFLPGGADAMRWGADAMFAAAPEAPVASSGPSVSRLSRGETDSQTLATQNADAATTAENDEESDDRKRARLVRNRESAMLSRQRKKQYVDELERKYRHAQSANGELRRLAQRLIAECEGLRHHLALATGDPPVARGIILEHPPPPGVLMEAPPKVAIPRVAAAAPAAPAGRKTGAPATTRGGAPPPGIEPPIAGESAPGSPDTHETKQRLNTKRRRVAPGSALAAAAAGALAVLSVVCVASERRKATAFGSASGALAVQKLAGFSSAFADAERADTHSVGAPKRRLLALASGEDPRSAEDTLGPGSASDAKERATFSALAATRAAVGDATDKNAIAYRFKTPSFEDFETDFGSDGLRDAPDASSGFETSFSSGFEGFETSYRGPEDPWYAALRGSHGLRRAEEFRRVACAEMFRFKPERVVSSGAGETGDDAGVSVVASDAFSARLRAEIDAEGDAESAETKRGDRNAGEKKKTRGASSLLPRAIPMPASATPTATTSVMSSPSGLPAPPPRTLSMGGIVDDDSSLVSVLLPPASASTKTVGSFDALSKLFVVTYSRRAGDYVTYSCGAE